MEKQSVKQTVKKSVEKSVDKAAKLAPKNLQPMIKDLPNRIVEKADQVLLGLSHTKESIPALLKQTLNNIEKNPSDLVGRVSRSVLERAETVRKQLIEKAEDSETLLKTRWVPEWLKDVSFVRAGDSPATNAPAGEAAHTAGVAADTIAAVQGELPDFDSSNIAIADAEGDASSKQAATSKKSAESSIKADANKVEAKSATKAADKTSPKTSVKASAKSAAANRSKK